MKILSLRVDSYEEDAHLLLQGIQFAGVSIVSALIDGDTLAEIGKTGVRVVFASYVRGRALTTVSKVVTSEPVSRSFPVVPARTCLFRSKQFTFYVRNSERSDRCSVLPKFDLLFVE